MLDNNLLYVSFSTNFVCRDKPLERDTSCLFHFYHLKSINSPCLMLLSGSVFSYCFVIFHRCPNFFSLFLSSSFIPLSPSFPPLHPSIHRPMAGWLLPISAEDPWGGLEQGCAPVGYWTQLAVKANGLRGGDWICHHWLLLFTNEGRGGRERESKRTLRDYIINDCSIQVLKCLNISTVEGAV